MRGSLRDVWLTFLCIFACLCVPSASSARHGALSARRGDHGRRVSWQDQRTQEELPPAGERDNDMDESAGKLNDDDAEGEDDKVESEGKLDDDDEEKGNLDDDEEKGNLDDDDEEGNLDDDDEEGEEGDNDKEGELLDAQGAYGAGLRRASAWRRHHLPTLLMLGTLPFGPLWTSSFSGPAGSSESGEDRSRIRYDTMTARRFDSPDVIVPCRSTCSLTLLAACVVARSGCCR